MVYGIVQKHGGHMIVDSDPGAGSTFKIYLPRVDEEMEAAGAEQLVVAPRLELGVRVSYNRILFRRRGEQDDVGVRELFREPTLVAALGIGGTQVALRIERALMDMAA